MYEYRTLSREAQRRLVDERRLRGVPLHDLPHRTNPAILYLLTATNTDHQPIMDTPARRDEFAHKLLSRFSALPDAELFAWCLLPNHYHLLAHVELEEFAAMVKPLHNGTSTQWNREDNMVGRAVWFSFSDRDIRGDRHFWASLNYIHANAAKHGYCKNAFDWPWSSVHDFALEHGKAELSRLWKEYPVRDYGKGWDRGRLGDKGSE